MLQIFVLAASTLLSLVTIRTLMAQQNPDNMPNIEKSTSYIEEKLAVYREKFSEIQPETNILEHPVFSQWVIKEQYFQAEESQMVLTVMYCKDDYFAAALADQVYVQMTERENFTWGVIGNIVYEINGANATEALEIEHLAHHLEGRSNFVNEWKMKILFGSYLLTQQPDLPVLQKILPVGYRFIKAENDQWFFQDFNGLGIEVSLYKGSSKIVFITFQEKKENEKQFADFLYESKYFDYWGSEHNTQYYKQLDKPRKYPNLYYNSTDNEYFKWVLSNEE